MRKLAGYIILWGLVFGVLNSSAQSTHLDHAAWKLKKNQDGIQVYTRAAEGSKFREIKVIGTIEGTLSQLYALFVDVERYDEIIYRTERAYLIERPNPFEFLYYTEIDFPWPASNRDLVIQVKFEPDPGKQQLRIRAENREGIKPHTNSIVRIPFWQSRWIVHEKNEHQLSIEYFFKVDPGGNLPAWIVNMTATEAPYRSFVNLEENLKLPRYQGKEYPFLDF